MDPELKSYLIRLKIAEDKLLMSTYDFEKENHKKLVEEQQVVVNLICNWVKNQNW